MPIFTSNTGSSTLKAYFETGDVPTANNFIDLIDSFATELIIFIKIIQKRMFSGTLASVFPIFFS